MPDVGISIDIKPAESLLNRLLGRVTDLSPVFRGPINESLSQFFLEQFESEGGRGGAKWAPLMPFTLKMRERPGHGLGGIEVDTGRFWASLTKIGPESILRITPNSFQRGTTVPYAKWQEQGWTSSMIFGHMRTVPTEVPPRPVVPAVLPRDLVASWQKMVTRYLEYGDA